MHGQRCLQRGPWVVDATVNTWKIEGDNGFTNPHPCRVLNGHPWDIRFAECSQQMPLDNYDQKYLSVVEGSGGVIQMIFGGVIFL